MAGIPGMVGHVGPGRSKKGALISFDVSEFEASLSSAVGVFQAFEKDSETLSYFCDLKGNGAFAPMIATAAATYIREGIQGIRHISGLGVLPALSSITIKKKGHSRFDYWTGAFAEHIIYKASHIGKVSTGRVTISAGTLAGSDSTFTSLARWLEHGTGRIPARPVLELGMHDFVAKKFPVLLHETKRVIMQEIVENHKGKKKSHRFNLGALNTVAPASTFKDLGAYRSRFTQSKGKEKARQILNKAGFASARLDKW